MKVRIHVEQVVVDGARRAVADDVRRGLLVTAGWPADGRTPSAQQVRAWVAEAARGSVTR